MGDGGPVSTTTSPPLFSPEQIQDPNVNQRLTIPSPCLYATLSLILWVTPVAPEAGEQSGEWWPERWMQSLTKPAYGKKLAKKKVGTTSQNLTSPRLLGGWNDLVSLGQVQLYSKVSIGGLWLTIILRNAHPWSIKMSHEAVSRTAENAG